MLRNNLRGILFDVKRDMAYIESVEINSILN